MAIFVDTWKIILYIGAVLAHLKGVVRFPCRAMRAGSGACGVGIGARASGGSCKRRLPRPANGENLFAWRR
jgi:hypothetical protein